MRFKQALIFFILFLFTAVAFSQQATKREWAIFQKGVKEYRKGNLKAAENIFYTLVTKLPESRLTTANTLMLAKIYYREKQYEKSLQLCNQFLKKYPDSDYSDDIQFLIGKNYYRLNRYQSALSTWLFVAGSAKDDRLQKKAMKLARDLMRFRLDEATLREMASDQKSPFARQAILYHLAENDYQNGNSGKALMTIKQILNVKGGHKSFYEKASHLQQVLENKTSGKMRIAFLLPLSGDNGDIGQAMLRGAKMALSEFNHTTDPMVEIVPYDYQTQLTTALQQFKEIASDPSISAIFGPVENDITAACATLADYEKMPVISPTASDENIRRLSENVVQLNIPLDVLSIKLASYAADSLGLHRYASLAPIDNYFIRFQKYFKEYQQKHGNTFAAEQWYYPEEQDITKHFKALKRVGIKLAFQDSVLQIDSTLSQSSLDSLYRIYHQEQVKRLEEMHTKVDSADIPVTTLDGLLLTIYQSDITMMASQYAYWNLQSTLLGNSDWYDEEQLKKNRKYINGLIFVSDGYLNKESWDYRKFRNQYRMTYKSTPDKFALIGYDSFRFLLAAISESGRTVTRENFRDIVMEAPDFNGIYRNFIIGKKRYNNAVRILKFTYGQILPLN